jgi:hypothetical protein
MTNAIEQAKREMYKAVAHLRGTITINYSIKNMLDSLNMFEGEMESYLELLRQDHEALHETARKRFEDLQVAEAKVEEFSLALASANLNFIKVARESRDSIRKLESVNRSYARELLYMTEARDKLLASTSGQTSGDHASCATPDAKTMVILGSVLDVQRIVSDWALGDSKAKHSMRKIAAVVNGDLEVAKALDAFENPGKYSEMVFHWQFDEGIKTTYSLEKVKCQHSFFAIGQDQMKCTFCGVGK